MSIISGTLPVCGRVVVVAGTGDGVVGVVCRSEVDEVTDWSPRFGPLPERTRAVTMGGAV